jgi:hypothetical protein
MLGWIFFTASGANQVHEQTFHYAYQQHYLLSQFLPLKMAAAEWVAKNIADELNMPGNWQ